MKTIIVTGATSFLGRNVIKELLKHDCQIYAFVRENSKDLWRVPQDNRVKYIYGYLDNLDVILEHVDKADCFVHFAWDGQGYNGRASEDVQQTNVTYSMNALKIAHTLGCKQFIFPGSQAEYGICHDVMTEEMPTNPISAYGKAKKAFSKQAMEFVSDKQIQFIHLRIFSVYGPDDREGTLVDACVKKFNTAQLMELGPCTQRWNYLYIQDFAALVYDIIESACVTGIYNVAGDDTRPLREYVEWIYKMSNKTGEYRFGETSNNPEGSPELIPSIDKVKKATGWSPSVSFEEGIHLVMETVLHTN